MSHECLDIIEDSRGWGTNYFCWKDDSRFVNAGFSYFSSGFIPRSGARCTLLENDATEEWSDNYLCVPNETPYRFEWSCNGDLIGPSCINWNDPDNSIFDNCYLCLGQPPTGKNPQSKCHLRPWGVDKHSIRFFVCLSRTTFIFTLADPDAFNSAHTGSHK